MFWEPGDPNNMHGGEDCAAMRLENLRTLDTRCDYTFKALCEKPICETK